MDIPSAKDNVSEGIMLVVPLEDVFTKPMIPGSATATQLKVVFSELLSKVTSLVEDPLGMNKSSKGIISGVGFTVIVNCSLGPVQSTPLFV